MDLVQYLINNAGVASWGGLGQLTEEELLHCIRTNTLGPLLVTQEVLGAKLLKNGSVVANLTSKVHLHVPCFPLLQNDMTNVHTRRESPLLSASGMHIMQRSCRDLNGLGDHSQACTA